MTPTKEDKQWLRKHLNGLLHYSETCAELYDHILTALEQKPDTGNFKTAVNHIIENDFGGVIGLAAIEWRYHTITTADIQKKYRLYLRSFFSIRYVPLLLAVFILIYWIAGRAWFTSYIFMMSYFALSMVISLLSSMRHIRTGFALGNTKASVKDDGFDWMKKAPAGMFFIVILSNLIFRFTLDITPVKYPGIVATISMLLALHTLAFYKIYKEQFKISFI